VPPGLGPGPAFGTAASNVSVGTQALPLLEGRLTVQGSGSAALRHSLPECATQTLEGTFQEDGTFLPTHCTRREVGFEQFDTCMAKLGGRVAVMGDSNSRRSMKRLMSRGVWCGAPGESELFYCDCEDVGSNDCVEPGLSLPWATNSEQTGVHYGNGSSLTYQAFGGFPFNTNFFVSPSLATVAVVGYLGAWPEAAANATEFTVRLAATVDMLLTLPPSVRFIFRSAPYFCCFAGRFHRYSEKRQRLFTRMYRDAVLGAFPGRAYWWDTRALTEPRPLAEIGQRASACRSNHLPSELVAEDLKTLMHLLCLIADGG
jgi:hypothetical protein